MQHRLRLLALASVCAVATAAPRANADELLLLPPGSHTVVLRAEEATTFGAAQTTQWIRLGLEVDAPEIVWLVPLTAPARADLVSDTWLDSLAIASAPRVLPPSGSPPCIAPAGPEVARFAPDGTWTTPEATRVLSSDGDLSTYAAQKGVVLENATSSSAHGVFAAGNAILALSFSAQPGLARTPTVRIVSAAQPGVGLRVSSMYLTSYAIGPGRGAFGGGPAALDPSLLTWGESGSNYGVVRSTTLTRAGAGHFLTESASHGAYFLSGTAGPGVTIPSVADEYFDLTSCTKAAQSIVSSNARVSSTCVPGSIGRIGDDGCDETPGARDIDAHTLRCTGDDYALALAGQSPGALVLTRAITDGDEPVALAQSIEGEKNPTVRASSWDDLCLAATGPSAIGGGGGNGGGGGGGGGGDGVSVGGDFQFGASGDCDPAFSDCAGDPSTEVTADSSDSSSDSCDGSSSSSSSDSSSSSGDSCGGSSDSSSSSGDGCGSSSGSSGGDSCGGGGGGDSCSGGGGGADGCSGGGGGGDCSIGSDRRTHGHRRGTSPFSRIALGVIAALFVWRRKRRPA